ncbi:MAG: hypothetical protein LBP28_04205, partial [Coriobacteriales bacterium]|nr:hypothetical protein [Coriobacteriales bacterium]
ITGGSVKAASSADAKISPAPKNAAGSPAPVFLNTLTVGFPAVGDNEAVSDLTVDGVSDAYGVNDVATRDGGVVYFWLAANSADDAQVRLEAAEGYYAKTYVRNANDSNVQTLEREHYLVVEGEDSTDPAYVEWEGGVLTFKQPNEGGYSISMADDVTSTTEVIAVSGSGTYAITLNNVTIDASDLGAGTSAFTINDDINVNLTLNGANTLKASQGAAGLRGGWGNWETLTIDADATGSLIATGGTGDDSAGIYYDVVNISGGTITATGGTGDGSAGISGYVVTVSGGTVTATGGAGDDSAGISGDVVTISGGSVEATGGGSSSDGISSYQVNISDGIVTATGGAGDWSDGIYSVIITISGGTVNATGGTGADGAGGGSGISGYETIDISGGEVRAQGGLSSAGIGSYPGEDIGAITISGGSVTAIGGDAHSYDEVLYGAGAGIGFGGSYYNGDEPPSGAIAISGGTVTATGGTGAGDSAAADIGFGGSFAYPGDATTTITISGGSVKASSALPAPKSAADGGIPVYLNTLTVGSPAIADGKDVSNLSVDGAASSYGLAGVLTKDNGKLYFWLGANSTETAEVQLDAEGTNYGATYERAANNDNTATLLPPAVTISAIPNISAPVVGGTPATTTETAQYTGTISWSPEVAPGDTFTWDTDYTATITLTPKTGWTFEGIPANFFTVAGATLVQNAANSGTVTAAFPITAPAKAALESTIKEAKAIERTFQTAASWEALQAAIAKGEAVDANPNATEAEVAAALTAINDAIAAQYFDYPVMEAFGTWSGTGPLSARINADVKYFSQLKLNGSLVATTNYTVTSGSTVLTLHEAYLKSLPAGNHSFIAEFSNGTSAPMSLTISASSGGGGGGGTVPKTGDDILGAVALVAALAAAAAASLALSRYLRRRARREGRS